MNHNTKFAVRIALLCALPISLSVVSNTARADNAEADFTTARVVFDQARAGDGAASERAADLFAKLSEKDPSNPLYLVYCGSSWALRARSAWAPWNKMKLAERGLDMIDRALAMLTPQQDQVLVRGVPLSEETRLVAASSLLALPSLFHRFEDGKAVVAAARTSPAFTQTPPPVRAALEYQGSLVARQEGRTADEVQALQRVLALQPEGAVAAQAKARLQEVGQP